MSVGWLPTRVTRVLKTNANLLAQKCELEQQSTICWLLVVAGGGWRWLIVQWFCAKSEKCVQQLVAGSCAKYVVSLLVGHLCG